MPARSSSLISSFGRQAKVAAVLRVALVLVGDDGVDPVVAAVELNDDQDSRVSFRLGSAGGPGEEAGDGRGQ